MNRSATAVDAVRSSPEGRAISFPALCLLGVALLSAESVAAAAAPAEQDDAVSGFDLTLERATELQDAGSYDAALQIYRSLREDRPADPRLLYEIARASLSAGDFRDCVDHAALSVAHGSRYQAAAYGLMARCQQRAGDADAGRATLAAAVQRTPQDATLRFEYAMALRDRDRDGAEQEFAAALRVAATRPDLFLAYGAVLEAEDRSGGALLMNLRYVMSSPESPAAIGAAESILKAMDSGTTVATGNTAADPLARALTAARQAANVHGKADLTPAERLNRFLQTFVLDVVSAEDPALEASPVWSGGVEPLLTMAEHDVLDTFLYFVGALARTEGSPEWLSAHRPQFDRLVEYLAQPAT